TRAQWTQFATVHDCCLEPVLDLDEALASELVGEREMVVTLDQPGVGDGVRQLGIPVKLDRTPGEHNRLPGPVLGEHTEQVLRAAGYSEQQVAELLQQGAVAGQSDGAGNGAFLA
ncbi:MAG: CoA transferase, partial [Solirubrobacteraceae bacterium]